jgi:hypothetical protein
MDYFNTHPYMALFVMGDILRLEEEYAQGGKTLDEISLIKKQLGGPLAALGDKIFWSTWRPLMGLVGVIGTMFIYKCARTDIVITLKKINSNILIKYLPVFGLTLISIILIMALFIYESQGYGWYLLGGTVFTVIARSAFKLSATRLVYLITLIVIAGNLIFKGIGY